MMGASFERDAEVLRFTAAGGSLDERGEPTLTPAQARAPLTAGDLSAVMGALGDVMREYMTTTIAPLLERVAVLEAKAKESFEYRGVFHEGETYERGHFVSHRGALWHANKETRSIPGRDSCWTLAVKSGQQRR